MAEPGHSGEEKQNGPSGLLDGKAYRKALASLANIARLPMRAGTATFGPSNNPSPLLIRYCGAEVSEYLLAGGYRTFASLASTQADLVAHSFGAAVALRYALDHPAQVRSLTLVEPTWFAILRDLGPKARDARREIVRIARAFTPSGPDQDRMFAIARFVNYWNGARAWAELPSQRQEMLALKSDEVRRDFEAIFAERLPLAAFRKFYVPTLVVTGTASPAAALLVAEGLARAAPRASTVTVTGAGHMLPITHAPDLIRILRTRFEVGASSSLKAA